MTGFQVPRVTRTPAAAVGLASSSQTPRRPTVNSGETGRGSAHVRTEQGEKGKKARVHGIHPRNHLRLSRRHAHLRWPTSEAPNASSRAEESGREREKANDPTSDEVNTDTTVQYCTEGAQQETSESRWIVCSQKGRQCLLFLGSLGTGSTGSGSRGCHQ